MVFLLSRWKQRTTLVVALAAGGFVKGLILWIQRDHTRQAVGRLLAAARAGADQQAALVRRAGFALARPGWCGRRHAALTAALRLRARRRASPIFAAQASKPSVGLRQRKASTSANRAASVLSVARRLNSSARSRRSPARTSGGKSSMAPWRLMSRFAVTSPMPSMPG